MNCLLRINYTIMNIQYIIIFTSLLYFLLTWYIFGKDFILQRPEAELCIIFNNKNEDIYLLCSNLNECWKEFKSHFKIQKRIVSLNSSTITHL